MSLASLLDLPVKLSVHFLHLSLCFHKKIIAKPIKMATNKGCAQKAKTKGHITASSHPHGNDMNESVTEGATVINSLPLLLMS